MEDSQLPRLKYVPEQMEHRIRNALGLLQRRAAIDRGKVKDQLGPRVHRNTASDWSFWAMFRLVDHVIHSNLEDWAAVTEICNRLGQNDHEAKESFIVLINNIRSGSPAVQLSAAKLWVIMIYTCSAYFSDNMPMQTPLGAIEDVALSSQTSPVVRDRLVEVVGASVFLLRDAKTINPYQSTWMRLRQQLNLAYPAEGLAVDADDPILNPTSPKNRDTLSQDSQSEHPRPNIVGNSSTTELQQSPGQETRDRRADQEYEQRLTRSPVLEPTASSDSGPSSPDPMDNVQWLFEECETARGNCRILGDSLLYATSDSVLKDPLIKEFQEKAATSKEVIDAQLDSARTKADRARARRHSDTSGDATTRSTEEQLLQALVTTWVELENVLETYNELVRLARTKLRVDSQETPIGRQMDTAEVVSHLTAHGCKDLSSEIDPSSFGEYPASHGGLSDVYSGRLSNGREVALKLLRVSASSLGQYPKHLKHAAQELHTWNKCNHPNVVPLLGLAVFRGRIGMVSPWMDHGSLPHYLEQIPDPDRDKLCVQICEGLAYLHHIGIIHGDMKGANVLISNDGTPVLTDFGSAFLIDRTMKFTPTTSSGSLTIRWAAAEIINGSRPTEAADVYALGMILYEIVSGRLPYHGHSDITIILRVTVKKETPERPRCMPSGHQDGEKLWSLFMRCWDYEPNMRPSAAEVASEMTTISLRTLPPNGP